jgi:glyoxylase-like metal-dependent hydrolase (beta-lactamase superfamily II)
VSHSDDHYQVVIVKYGTRETVRSDVYLNYSLYHEGDGPIGMDYFFWIIRNAQRTVVVDTGFSRHGGEVRGRTSLAIVPELFEKLGVDPGQSPDVILTHAHYDHAGNLNLFPSSRVFMAQQEYEFWSSRHAHRAMFHHSVEDQELDYLHEVAAQGRLTLFRDRIEVAPGIEVMVVGGHTPGQCVVKVQTDDGVVLLASDAIHYYEEYEADKLFMSVADLVEMYEAFDQVREMEVAGAIHHLVSGHDPDTLGRFTPVSGELSGLVATIGSVNGNA